MPEREVPLDPYALGLLLGDGCLTTRTTPSFSTNDPELVEAMEAALPGVRLAHKSGVDYVLQHVDGGRGGVIVANPVTQALRSLGLAGTRSTTKFVPPSTCSTPGRSARRCSRGCWTATAVPCASMGRSCRIQYTTCSDRLRDDVVFLVRSLGGVAYARTRRAEGARPRARPAAARSTTAPDRPRHRRPAAGGGRALFRLARKRDIYREHGGGRPMRLVTSIEPAGTAECVCISVGAADSLYVTDDFLVTHNTLNDSFVILDEAQNTSPEQMQMFLTRLGFGSRMVITGDVTQIDLPRDQRSGLIAVRDILEDVDGIDFVSSGARTSCATASCSGSSTPTPTRPSAARPSCARPTAGGPRAPWRWTSELIGTASIAPAEVERLAALAAASAGVEDGHVAVEFVDAARIAELNAEHRGEDGPTDVLSFPIDEDDVLEVPPEQRELGDVVICPDFTEDLREAVVHGVLHLTGMDHETDEGEMLALQREILSW
jgi:phosphate starvation-inducible PhoH-like protein